MSSIMLPHIERACCVCGSNARVLCHEIRDPARLTGHVDGRVQPVSVGEQIVRCHICGLLYVNPVIVWPPGGRAYPVDHDLTYFRDTRRSREIGNWHLLGRVEALLGKPGRWLDVGAGDGLLVDQAQAAGWEALGIEIDAELVAALGLPPGAPRVLTVPLEEADLFPAFFDVISLVNVLEHVDAPDEMVAACVRLLRPGGLLIVHVPNAGSLGARLRGARWRHYEPLSHLTYFDQGTLARLLERHGFEPVAGFSLPGEGLHKRAILAVLDRLGLHWHDGLGILARVAG
jgi:SAM-dependent methyltransferase